MNKAVIKNIIILSLIFGAIIGLLAPIPYIGTVCLFAVMFLSAPAVMIYLIMDGKLDLTTVQNSIIVGAGIGFVANFSFSISYCCVMAIMYLFKYTTNYILTSMIVKSPIWLLLVFIFFVGVMFAVTNAFSGFITHYAINFLRDMYEQKQSNSLDVKNKDLK